jgi:hypothetical protein
MRAFRTWAWDVYDTWTNSSIQIAKHALGKYIIGFACLLHLIWAALLAFDIRAGNATPLSILFILFPEKWAVIFVLVTVAIMAGGFLDLRLRARYNLAVLSMLLIPQQIVLWMSAGAGINAAIVGHYADGVVKSFYHIAADQSPCVLMAFLYTVALLETRHPPVDKRIIDLHAQISKGDKGDKGERGEKGERGPRGKQGKHFRK